MKTLTTLSFILLCLVSCSSPKSQQQEEWVSLFNGKDLDGWTVKISGYPVGENFGNTFRAEDGMLKVRYDAYDDDFNNRFGHIFTNKSYSSYKLRLEYRFVDEPVKGAPAWAAINNGIMFHAQTPESMELNQSFPVSIEAQLLGGDGTGEPRPTGSACTPGTEIDVDGKRYTPHTYASHGKTFDGDQWVKFELVVYADSLVHHIVNGDTILTYTHLVIGGEDATSTPELPFGPLKEGRIALQSESHPTDFRNIEIMEIKK